MLLHANSMDLLHRPVYHFLPPANWMNDPNGLIQWKGTYHLFYQHNPFEARWGPMHWGHAVSPDLIHWQHKPIALAPTPGGPDQDGCWSGVAVIKDGAPVIVYSGNREGKQRACLACSRDDLETLQKYPGNPVIPEPPGGFDLREYRDHCVWREGSEWYQLMGARIKDTGGAAFLYQSDDLVYWKELGPLVVGGSLVDSGLPEDVTWECPDFFSLGDQHMLVISVNTGEPSFTGYFLGTYQDHRFMPALFRKLDYGDTGFYAPQSFVNEAGERIQLGWIGEGRSLQAQLASGWAGVQSLPRMYSLVSRGRLEIQPYQGVDILRGERTGLSEITVLAGSDQALSIEGSALEIQAEFASPDRTTATEYGLKIYCSPDGIEETAIRYNRQLQRIEVDRMHSSLDGSVSRQTQGGLLELDEGEGLSLRVYIDHSVIEVFANRRAVITCRVYPTRPDSCGVKLYACGGSALLNGLNAWKMNAIW
jgi:beta-fructofuranosidase